MNTPSNASNNSGSTRRSVLGMGLGLTAALALAPTGLAQERSSQPGNVPGKSPAPIGRRKLGSLEVSAVGLGVQNMSRIGRR